MVGVDDTSCDTDLTELNNAAKLYWTLTHRLRVSTYKVDIMSTRHFKTNTIVLLHIAQDTCASACVRACVRACVCVLLLLQLLLLLLLLLLLFLS